MVLHCMYCGVQVRLARPEQVDYEAVAEYNMTVIGSAAGEARLYSYAALYLTVLDTNDNKPRFTQQVTSKLLRKH